MTRLRLALAGAGAVLLGACAMPPARQSAPPVPAPVPAPIAVTPQPPPAVIAPAPVDVSPWPRLRGRFAMRGCDYRPEVRREARRYTRYASGFTHNLKEAMPFLLLVTDEIERRDLPGEFALLPYVESSYRPLPASGNRPAGMWQLMPKTARAEGLVVRRDYDARLDVAASTTAALDLIERYYREFADWRLADMAFNSGEYRVRRLLGERDARTLTAAQVARIALSPTTHQHLDRLLALACIVHDPARFGITLPDPEPGDRLQDADLERGMDLRLAARLAGVDHDAMQRWNAAYRSNRMGTDVPHRLLMPEAAIGHFREQSKRIPALLWNDWRERRAVRVRGIASWAEQFGVAVSTLAAANAIDENATVHPPSRLLVPASAADADHDAGTAVRSTASRHTVVAGDTLSGIAHRYAITLRRLMELNPQARGTLHVGDTLRLDGDAG